MISKFKTPLTGHQCGDVIKFFVALFVSVWLLFGCGGDVKLPYPIYAYPNVTDLSVLGDSAKAERLIQITEKIFRTYKFKDIGARYPSENTDPVIDSYAGGVCDSAVAAFIDLTSSDFNSYQADVVYPQDNIGLGAHSFVYIPAGNNHLIVDPVYGFIFVGSGNNPTKTFHDDGYKKYAIGIESNEFEKKIGYSGTIYDYSTDERFDVALPEEFIKATFGLIPIIGEFTIFDTKGSGFLLNDLSLMPSSGDPIAAAYFINVGNYYRKTIQKYVFNFKEASRVRMRFELERATTNPFDIKIIIGNKYIKSNPLNTLVPNECMSINLTFIACQGDNSVEIINENSMGYRGLRKFIIQILSAVDFNHSDNPSLFYDNCF